MPRQVSASTVRILMVLSVVLITAQLILLFCHCRCNHTEYGFSNSLVDRNEIRFKENGFKSTKCLLNYTKDMIVELQQTIKELERKLSIQGKLDKVLISQDISFLKRQNKHHILSSYTPKNEYDVIPFDAFTLSSIYGDVGTLSKNPAEGVSGRRGIEHNEAIRFAVKTFQADVESKSDPVLPMHLAEGIMRNDRLVGTVYELHFRSDIPDVFKRIRLVRPFGPLEIMDKTETIDTSRQLINVIVPLSGRIEKFRDFMARFVEVGIRYDRKVYLTVIFFGVEGRDQIREILGKISNEEKFTDYKVIFTGQEFSRGAALQKGAESWLGGNVLMFFCDVDIYFTLDFLERCRLYTSPGQRVYYPIVYSQYNPIIVYGGQTIPPLQQQMKLSKDSGFWRDFGFGMTCQYKHDFLQVGGFDLSIKGWGMEDVRLYRKYLHSDIEVVRAYDRNIFHIYHEKKCSRTLSDDQFISCLQSKAVSEGSHKQMGMLAFGKYLLGNEHPDWGKLLESSLTGAVEQANSEVKTQQNVSPSLQPKNYLVEAPGGKAPVAIPNSEDDAIVEIEEKISISDPIKFAENMMMHALELELLYNHVNAKLKGHHFKEKFKVDLENMRTFQKRLQVEATNMLAESQKLKKTES